MPKPTPPHSLVMFLRNLEDQDKTLAEWARERNFPYRAVYALVSGHHSGRSGQARTILKAMGLKPPPMFPARRNTGGNRATVQA